MWGYQGGPVFPEGSPHGLKAVTLVHLLIASLCWAAQPRDGGLSARAARTSRRDRLRRNSAHLPSGRRKGA